MTNKDDELFDPTYPASKYCINCRAAKDIGPPEFKKGQGGAKSICLRCGYTYMTVPSTEGPIVRPGRIEPVVYPSELEPGVLARMREEHEQLWLSDDWERTTLAAGRIIEYVTGWRVEGIATGAATQPADFRIQYPNGAVPLAVAHSTSSRTLGDQPAGHPNPEDDDRPVLEVVTSSILTQANDQDVIAKLEDSGEVFVWAKGAIHAASTQLAASPEDDFESSMRLLPQLESHVPGAIKSLWVAEDPDTAPKSELTLVWQWRPGYEWTPYNLLPIKDKVQAILWR